MGPWIAVAVLGAAAALYAGWTTRRCWDTPRAFLAIGIGVVAWPLSVVQAQDLVLGTLLFVPVQVLAVAVLLRGRLHVPLGPAGTAAAALAGWAFFVAALWQGAWWALLGLVGLLPATVHLLAVQAARRPLPVRLRPFLPATAAAAVVTAAVLAWAVAPLRLLAGGAAVAPWVAAGAGLLTAHAALVAGPLVAHATRSTRQAALEAWRRDVHGLEGVPHPRMVLPAAAPFLLLPVLAWAAPWSLLHAVAGLTVVAASVLLDRPPRPGRRRGRRPLRPRRHQEEEGGLLQQAVPEAGT